MSKEEALKGAALVGNVDGFPLLILMKIFDERKNPYPSASTISSATWRQIVLTALIPHYVRPRGRMPLVRGSLIHGGFETFPGPQGIKLIRELRLRHAIPDFVNRNLTGSIDLYFPQFLRLEDWKSCSRLPELIRPNHLVQLAVYYWLLTWSKHKVERVCINYVTWNDCIQLREAKLETGETAEAIGHILFQSEKKFVNYMMMGWEILQAGFQDNSVPPMTQCNIDYCRYCPVKWACDGIHRWGEIINPDDFVQEDYL